MTEPAESQDAVESWATDEIKPKAISMKRVQNSRTMAKMKAQAGFAANGSLVVIAISAILIGLLQT